ncbi:TIGR04222 domain-containing membrane protein [Saccharothrix sp. NRRL B-16314]|uniref:TIGR04222 domain-containing membrane protein n=1 Tax=Saccharothrix sp. NRRL B-16314 TaxID=1463825 RepID=UPI0018CBFAC4|nr:TIGR04222 domain-containing membrane protein [Saccharothrix sp. NRRL B-16314]
MERPWGLSGPEFLELYWIALAVTLGIAIFVRVRLRGTRGVVPAGVLGLLDIAYLTGGPRRVAETSVAGLLDAGTLVPARSGSVRIADSTVPAHPVDQAVLADATRYRYRTLTLLITSVSDHDAVLDVGRRLSSMDYLVAPEVAKSRLRAGVVPMVLLFVVGVARSVNGLVIGAPVGWLTLQLVLTGVLVGLLVKASPLMLTATGREAVAKARAGGITGGWGGTGSGSANAAELVALNGFSAHPDVLLRAAARTAPFPRPGARSSGSRRRSASGGAYAGGTYSATTGGGCGSGSSSCSSGSSSCGGGGCGGGGGS